MPEGNFSDRPGRVIGEVGGQHADAQLRIAVEVEETVGTVDIVKGREGGHTPVNGHGVEAQLATAGQEQPVGIGT